MRVFIGIMYTESAEGQNAQLGILQTY